MTGLFSLIQVRVGSFTSISKIIEKAVNEAVEGRLVRGYVLPP